MLVCVGVCWCVLMCVGVCWCMLRYCGVCGVCSGVYFVEVLLCLCVCVSVYMCVHQHSSIGSNKDNIYNKEHIFAMLDILISNLSDGELCLQECDCNSNVRGSSTFHGQPLPVSWKISLKEITVKPRSTG